MAQRIDICLVRHGETEWNRTGRYQGTSDIPLNELGRKQAKLGAKRLAFEQWDAVLSSPLSRARTTAETIAEAVGIGNIEFLDDLQERAYGEAEGLTIAEREARWPEGSWPGLEALEHLWERSTRLLRQIAKLHAGKRVLVVSHGGTINGILHVVSGGEIGSGLTRILNVSLTRIHSDDGASWTVDVVSDAEHLIGEDGQMNALMPANVDASGLAAARSGT